MLTQKIDYSKYVPVKFFHLDLYKFQENNGFKRESSSMEQELHNKFNACLEDMKFSWDRYFKYFGLNTIGNHFIQLYDNTYSTYGKNFAVYVNNVEHGNILAESLNNSKFTVINVCGNKKVSLGYINRMLNESDKPVIMISCGRYLTGVTLEKLHGLIIMGTCNSVVAYIQYGLRGKNTYPDREYCCTIFDLNTYSILKTDAFKEAIIAKTYFTGKSIKDILFEEYNENCFEIFELNSYNILEPVKNFAEELHNNWLITETGDSISSLIINEDTIPENYFNDIIFSGITLEDIKLHENKLLVTPKQCDKPSKNKKNQKNKERDKNNKVIDYKLWLVKLMTILNKIPGYLFLCEKNSLEQIINENDEDFEVFCPNGIKILIALKDIWYKNNEQNRWQNLNDAVVSIAKKLQA